MIAAHSRDWSGSEPAGEAVAVAFAESVDDVQAVLRAANETVTPVVVRGAGTGLAGGATATAGCIVLNLSRFDRIVSISAPDALTVVEPGAITADVDRAAAAHGLRYAPDPASVAISTIGGNIATNAGGLRCAKYGVTRDSVLGLDVVLADGELISTGRRTVKGVAGYDLTSLFVGSEGTLGVVVGATLRLRPIPAATSTVAAYFASAADAVVALAAVSAAGFDLAMAELLDARTLRALDAAGSSDFAVRGNALLLVQTDGSGARPDAEAVAALLARSATSAEATDDPARADALLEARRGALPAMQRLGRTLIEDIAVPRSRIAEAIEAVDAIGRAHGVDIFTIAHAADGNLHPIIVVGDAIPPAAWAAADDIFTLALRLGGTVTGEHGIGVLKRRWLGAELGSRQHDLQRALRLVFDPHSILNPGKAV